MAWDVIDTDVLIIGSGGAGCWAAIAADEVGVDITIVSKGLFTKDGSTTMATGAVNIAIGHADPRDTPRQHFIDTIEGGDYLNDQQLARLICEEIFPRLIDVETFGMLYARRDEGKLLLSRVGGHTYPRTTVLGDWTGSYLMRVLGREVMRRNVRILEDFVVTSLLESDGKIVGAVGFDMQSSECVVIRATSTVLACGGAGQIFEVTSNPAHITGDGYAMAYRIGAELIDLEETQFHPTGLAYPIGKRGTLVTELCRGLGAKLFNIINERFMFKYDSRGELAERDVVARGNYREIMEGRGTPHGGVCLDCTYIPEEKRPILRETYIKIKMLVGVDMWEEPIEVVPTAHFFMGGLHINSHTETNVPRLFACGEVVGGTHGSNRLGANAKNELFVFGYRAGKFAAEHSRRAVKLGVNWDHVKEEESRIHGLFRNGTPPTELKKSLKNIMSENVGVGRSEEGLKRAIYLVEGLREREVPRMGVSEDGRKYRSDLVNALEIYNMLDVAELVARSALFRTESRGAHYRIDYPKRDDENWRFHTGVKLDKKKMTISKTPIKTIE